MAEECGYKDGGVAKKRWSQIKRKKLPNASSPIKSAGNKRKQATTDDADDDDDDDDDKNITVKPAAKRTKTKAGNIKNEDAEDDDDAAEDEGKTPKKSPAKRGRGRPKKSPTLVVSEEVEEL